MKIRLALLDSDASYLNRLTSYFSTRYSDKLEVHAFVEAKEALCALSAEKIDVFIADDDFLLDESLIPSRCCLAYFVNSNEISRVNGKPAVCKFQKIDLIYKQIINILSDKPGPEYLPNAESDAVKVIVFSSPCGGTGTSSMAAACAQHFASGGKRVLCLNLERYGSLEPLFAGTGQYTLSDVIYALKSKKANLALKLESCVKRDAGGVYYYAPARVSLEMLEMSWDDIEQLFLAVRESGLFEYIIVDIDFSLEKGARRVYAQADAIVWVGDGTEATNQKLSRAFTALSILEQGSEDPLTEHIAFVYNKFSSKAGKTLEGLPVRTPGGAPKLEHATQRQVVEHLAGLKIFDSLL